MVPPNFKDSIVKMKLMTINFSKKKLPLPRLNAKLLYLVMFSLYQVSYGNCQKMESGKFHGQKPSFLMVVPMMTLLLFYPY